MNKSTPAPLVKISRAGLWFVWVLWPLCRGGCNVPRASNAHPYKASNKICALFLAIRRNRLCGELRGAGAACGVDVGGELSASAVHLAERTVQESSDINNQLMALTAEFGVLQNLPIDNPSVQAQAAKLQAFITEHYYTCTKEIFAQLGQMYGAGGCTRQGGMYQIL